MRSAWNESGRFYERRKGMMNENKAEMIIPDGICDECVNCKYYWENQDDEYMNCDGEESPCHEFIDISKKRSVENDE